MATPKGAILPQVWSPMRIALESLLADGQWHTRTECRVHAPDISPTVLYRSVDKRMRRTLPLAYVLDLGLGNLIRYTARNMGCEIRGRGQTMAYRAKCRDNVIYTRTLTNAPLSESLPRLRPENLRGELTDDKGERVAVDAVGKAVLLRFDTDETSLSKTGSL